MDVRVSMEPDQSILGKCVPILVECFVGCFVLELGIGATNIHDIKASEQADCSKLLDPAKVDVKRTYTTEFVKSLKVMP